MKLSTFTVATCGACALALGLTGCGASFEGSGSKDAASAEQLAMRIDDPWAREVVIDPAVRADRTLHDGIYSGTGRGMEGPITVTLLVNDGHISCLEMIQEGESQSRGGYEAIRDGKFAAMIEAAQGSDIDTISGATITTAGVKQAVESALLQAEAGTSDSTELTVETVDSTEETVTESAESAEAVEPITNTTAEKEA